MTTEDIKTVNKKINIDADVLEFLRTSIENASDSKIMCKIEDFKKQIKQMDIDTRETSTSIYWRLKYALFAEGFVVTAGKTIIGEHVLVIRKKIEGDTLPLKNLTIHNDSKILISMNIDGEDIFRDLDIEKEYAISLLEEMCYGGIGNEKYKIDEVSVYAP